VVSYSLNLAHPVGCKSSKIISRLVSFGCLILANLWIYSKGETLKFWPKVTHPRWIERRRHSMGNCGGIVTLTDSAMVTMGIGKHHCSFQWLRPPLPSKWVSQMHPLWYVEFWMAISPQRVIRSTSCIVFGYRVFEGWRIEWRYFRRWRHRAVFPRQHGFLVHIRPVFDIPVDGDSETEFR